MDRRVAAVLVAAVALGASACSGAPRETTDVAAAAAIEATTAPPSSVTIEAAPTTVPTTTTAAPTTTTIPPRTVVQPTGAFATVGPLTLVHPSSRVERVGFHQSNHEGAQEYIPLPTAVNAMTMEPRERLTAARTAADIVVDPLSAIVAPVTGTVKRAGGYILYCEHRDDFVVIAPDAQPAWEVKVLHISGVQLRAGARVVAAETVLAPRATPLPFESQVDEFTADPAWPHVHIEVVDPAIRNVPSPGGGC